MVPPCGSEAACVPGSRDPETRLPAGRALRRPASDEHRQLEGLLVVEPGIDARLVSFAEILGLQTARAADAFGHVLACQLEVNAAEPRAEALVDLEGVLELGDDVGEIARLDA